MRKTTMIDNSTLLLKIAPSNVLDFQTKISQKFKKRIRHFVELLQGFSELINKFNITALPEKSIVLGVAAQSGCSHCKYPASIYRRQYTYKHSRRFSAASAAGKIPIGAFVHDIMLGVPVIKTADQNKMLYARQIDRKFKELFAAFVLFMQYANTGLPFYG